MSEANPRTRSDMDLSSDRSEGEATNHAMALTPVTIACAPVGAWPVFALIRGLPLVAPGYLPAGLRPSKNENKMKSLKGHHKVISERVLIA